MRVCHKAAGKVMIKISHNWLCVEMQSYYRLIRSELTNHNQEKNVSCLFTTICFSKSDWEYFFVDLAHMSLLSITLFYIRFYPMRTTYTEKPIKGHYVDNLQKMMYLQCTPSCPLLPTRHTFCTFAIELRFS